MEVDEEDRAPLGRLLSWGHPELIGRDGDPYVPRVVSKRQRELICISAGKAHASVVLSNGDVFVWGMGLAGRLGLGDGRKRLRPTKVACWDDDEGGPPRARRVACGMFHTAIIDDEERLHTTGRGYKGFLGHKSQSNRSTFKPVASLASIARVEHVACAKNHTVLCTKDGRIFSFGFPNYGRLGHGDEQYRREPTLVEAMKDVHVVRVDARGAHTIALGLDGDVYTWGSNQNGRLGHGDVENRLSPKRVEALDGVNVVSIAAGYTFCMCLDSSGNVFTWGSNHFGQLGRVDAASEHSVPSIVPSMPPIDRIAAGDEHAMCSTRETIWAWGCNQHGQIGTGSTSPCVPEPRVVDAMGDEMDHFGRSGVVMHIACGGSISMAFVAYPDPCEVREECTTKK